MEIVRAPAPPLPWSGIRLPPASAGSKHAGAEFYGPDGMYPFAGHECARAFALISTNTADCNDNLEVSPACSWPLSADSRP